MIAKFSDNSQSLKQIDEELDEKSSSSGNSEKKDLHTDEAFDEIQANEDEEKKATAVNEEVN